MRASIDGSKFVTRVQGKLPKYSPALREAKQRWIGRLLLFAILPCSLSERLPCFGFIQNVVDNLKSQCGFKLAELIMSDQIYEQAKDETVKERLTQELEQLKQKSLDTDGKRGLIPKDKIKDLIGRSPDDMDTYIMRMYFELKESRTKSRIKATLA